MRLDRALSNDTFLDVFKHIQAITLARTSSDHHPICVKFAISPPSIHPQPFRFENVWFTHGNFLDCVKDSWGQPSVSLPDKLNKLSVDLSSWSKSVFGDIYKRKLRVLARLNGIQKSLDRGPNDYLLHLEVMLIEEYNLISFQEETLLR